MSLISDDNVVKFDQSCKVRDSLRRLVAFDVYSTFMGIEYFERRDVLAVHEDRKLVERSLSALVECGLATKTGTRYSISGPAQSQR